MSKQYTGTIASILEDRLADVLKHKTVEPDDFPALVLADIRQDLKVDPEAAPALLAALETVTEHLDRLHTRGGGIPEDVSDRIDQDRETARAIIRKAKEEK